MRIVRGVVLMSMEIKKSAEEAKKMQLNGLMEKVLLYSQSECKIQEGCKSPLFHTYP
jgi:hypothetical protein